MGCCVGMTEVVVGAQPPFVPGVANMPVEGAQRQRLVRAAFERHRTDALAPLGGMDVVEQYAGSSGGATDAIAVFWSTARRRPRISGTWRQQRIGWARRHEVAGPAGPGDCPYPSRNMRKRFPMRGLLPMGTRSSQVSNAVHRSRHPVALAICRGKASDTAVLGW